MKPCLECGVGVRSPGRTDCKKCHAAREQARRQRLLAAGDPRPCARCGGGPRYVTSSQISSYCKPCHLEVRHEIRVMQDHGITLAEYRAVMAVGACAICGSSKRLAYDHDHATGEHRGVLCNDCNVTLGIMGDDPARLRRAADYLEGVLS